MAPGTIGTIRPTSCITSGWRRNVGTTRLAPTPSRSSSSISKASELALSTRLTGGGFGFGLETNVRAAYNWLVQNFEDATPLKLADEIYIFGFSRGAFTARSLVGFISTCGLLRRGAPLTVNQLWQNYCLLGREHEHHAGPLTALFGERAPEFRRLPDWCGTHG